MGNICNEGVGFNVIVSLWVVCDVTINIAVVSYDMCFDTWGVVCINWCEFPSGNALLYYSFVVNSLSKVTFMC